MSNVHTYTVPGRYLTIDRRNPGAQDVVLASDYDQIKAEVSKQENNNMTLILRMQGLEAARCNLSLREKLKVANDALDAKNARIAEYAERHLSDFAELERLDKQLDEARELFMYVRDGLDSCYREEVDKYLGKTDD